VLFDELIFEERSLFLRVDDYDFDISQ